jgi:hypothetical protein
MQISICMRMNTAFLKGFVFKFCTLYSRNLVALQEDSVPLIQKTANGRSGEDQKSTCPRRDSNPNCPVVLQTVPCCPGSPIFQDPNCYWSSLSARFLQTVDTTFEVLEPRRRKHFLSLSGYNGYQLVVWFLAWAAASTSTHQSPS